MKTGAFIGMTSGLSIVYLSVLLVVAFTDEVSAKQDTVQKPKKPGGCANYGHSCFGGHGKRSMPDEENDRFNGVEADRENSNFSEEVREPSDDTLRRVLNSDEIQQVQDFIACRNRAIEASRRPRVERNPMPTIIKKWLNSQRRSYNDALETTNK